MKLSTIPTHLDHLNLGCGLNAPPGWLNVDGSWQVVLARRPWLKELLVMSRLLPRSQADIPWANNIFRLNFKRPLPFESDRFQVVYSSHTLEHLYHQEARKFLDECYRILRRDGICRVVVPDLHSALLRYQAAKAAGKGDAATGFMEEILVHEKEPRRGPLATYHRLTAFHQHKWMYDAESLRALFESCKFKDVRAAGFLDSRIGRIAEVEDRGRIDNGQGIAVEGIKA